MNSLDCGEGLKTRAMTALMPIMFRPLFGWKDAEENLFGQKITIRSADGSVLEGLQAPAKGMRKIGSVVLCHPFLKYGYSYFLRNGLAEEIASRGYDVICFNFKGFGSSTLAGSRFSDDVVGAVRFARVQNSDLPVHLFGLSFGGFHAVHALANGLKDELSSVVLDSVPPSVDRFFTKGVVGVVMKSLGKSSWRYVTGTMALSESWPRITNIPVLSVFGVDDELMKPTDLKVLEKIERTEILSFGGCGHLGAFKKHREEYLDKVVEFFAKNGGSGNGH